MSAVPLFEPIAQVLLAVVAEADGAELTASKVHERAPDDLPFEDARQFYLAPATAYGIPSAAVRMPEGEIIGSQLAALVGVGWLRSETRGPWPQEGGYVVWLLTDEGRKHAERLADERAAEEGAADALARWRAGESLSTLDLRAACHAAQRVSASDDERKLSAEVSTREAKEGAG